MTRAVILGLAGPVLTHDEAAFFRDADPWGFILFGRNVVSPEQLRVLTHALRDCVGRERAPILIDQEGGRVQRLRPPHWGRFPPGRAYEGRVDLARLGARLIAHDLADLGIDVACAPILDVPAPGAHEVIGDRAYGDTPESVTAVGRAVADGLLAGGVLPVIKHIPGHGRAGVDTHLALPVVENGLADLDTWDFAPFTALADLPMAMTAHVVFAAVDPARPATSSPAVIETVVRGLIGFDGLLMSDDLSMNALSGDLERRTRDALAAGCDIALHCNGDPAEMAAVVAAAPPLAGRAAARADAALAFRRPAEPFDAVEGRARFDAAFAMAYAA